MFSTLIRVAKYTTLIISIESRYRGILHFRLYMNEAFHFHYLDYILFT